MQSTTTETLLFYGETSNDRKHHNYVDPGWDLAGIPAAAQQIDKSWKLEGGGRKIIDEVINERENVPAAITAGVFLILLRYSVINHK